MTGVAEHELKRLVTGWEFNPGLGLPRAEMKMGLVLRNGFVGIERLIHIDQQMVVAAVRVAVARVSDPHVAETKAAPKSSFDDGAVLRPYEIQKGILRRGLPLSVRGEWQEGDG